MFNQSDGYFSIFLWMCCFFFKIYCMIFLFPSLDFIRISLSKSMFFLSRSFQHQIDKTLLLKKNHNFLKNWFLVIEDWNKLDLYVQKSSSSSGFKKNVLALARPYRKNMFTCYNWKVESFLLNNILVKPPFWAWVPAQLNSSELRNIANCILQQNDLSTTWILLFGKNLFDSSKNTLILNASINHLFLLVKDLRNLWLWIPK